MKNESFFKAWASGIKDYSKTPEAMLQTGIIVNCFIIIGLWLGAIQSKLTGNGVLAFIFFAFSLLQLLSLLQQVKAYRQLLRQKVFLRNLGGEKNV